MSTPHETGNIVVNLIAQHRLLQADLDKASILVGGKDIDSAIIDSLLKQFSKDLQDHLHLENDIFYVELLKKMEQKGLEVAKTRVFIAEMKKIGDMVGAFLIKFNSANSIDAHIMHFKKELDAIVSVLQVRIEAEESGVYMYWEMV